MRFGRLKLKLQLVCGESFAMGPGKADLLEAIDREGSISGGARALGMSYRRGWLLVDEMNRCFRERLVETNAARRGARLSDTGRVVLADYRALEAEVAAAARGPAYGRLEATLRTTPLAPRGG